MRPDELAKMPEAMEALFLDMQNRVMQDVVRRIRKTGEITSTADYQMQRLQILGNSSEFIESETKRVLDASYPEMFELYDKVVDSDYVRNEDLYDQVNADYIPYSENTKMQTWVSAVREQTYGDFNNITNSLGFSLIYTGGRRVFTPLSEYYQKNLDRACLDIVTGMFDYNTVLRRVVTEMTNSGIRTVDYASGRSNRIEVAVRRAIMTGVNQLSANISDQVADDLGTDTFEVTWHPGARPSHWWGGMVFTRAELIQNCRLGEAGGLCGINCRHSYHAFIPGVSVRTFTDDELRRLKEEEAQTRNWRGKEYNAYEATQKQRQMETVMRAQREKVQLLIDGGADPEEIMLARAKYQGQLDEYARFSKAMELKQQRERIYLDLRGRVSPANAFSNTGKYDKIKTYRSKMIAGKYVVTNADIIDILDKELSGVRMIKTPVYNGRIRSQGLTKANLYPWGEVKAIEKIEIGKQIKNTRECLIDTILHEQLEAKILLNKSSSRFYNDIYSSGDDGIHLYINRVIKRFFKGKGINYDLV